MTSLKQNIKFQNKMAILVKRIEASRIFHVTGINDEWAGMTFRVSLAGTEPVESKIFKGLFKHLPADAQVNIVNNTNTGPQFLVDIANEEE